MIINKTKRRGADADSVLKDVVGWATCIGYTPIESVIKFISRHTDTSALVDVKVRSTRQIADTVHP